LACFLSSLRVIFKSTFACIDVTQGGKKYVAKAITENTLFYGDNLDILRDYLIDECVSNKNHGQQKKASQKLANTHEIYLAIDKPDVWQRGSTL
jgi:hypothetical protein